MKDQVLARRQLGLWKRAAVTALLVGSVLNMINQGDALWGPAQLSVFHLILNYLVPFAVASFSAIQARRDTGRAGEE
jgi:hypothetical protein